MDVEKYDFSKKHLTKNYARVSKLKYPPHPSGSVRRTATSAFKVSICQKRNSDTLMKLSFLLAYIRKRQFERREKNEERKVKRTKRNDNLLTKIVVSFWLG